MTPAELAACVDRFNTERRVRAENLTHRGQPQHCPDCGAFCGHFSRCRPCRTRLSMEGGVMDVLGLTGWHENQAPYGDHS